MVELPGLQLLQEAGCLQARLSAHASRTAFAAETLREHIGAAGFGRWVLYDEALTLLLAGSADPASECTLQIGEARDASFSLETAPDAMQVWLLLIAARGGQPLAHEAIVLALGEAGVTYGIAEEAINAACTATDDGRFLVASGTPPSSGEDTRFELLCAEARDRAPRVSANGLIDFRELGAIPTVAAEDPLMRRIPATSGTPGRNVRGEVLEPVPGKNIPFAEQLMGAYVATDDANLLRAVFAGQPVRCGNGVNVEQILRVRNVNIATGNITFDGTVNIEGEVLPGMKVHVDGDIIISGVVDGAELEATGDIRIGGGIIAKAHVRAGGSVHARFVENASVTAGTTIAIEDSALQSELQANNQIVVGIKSTQRGRLVGGTARAMLLIRTPVLGSGSGGVTKLLLGVNPVLEAQYQDLQQRIAKLREEEQNLEKVVKHLARQPDKAAILERANASWQAAVKAWGRLLPGRDELERQMDLMAGARIEVGVNAEGAIDVMLGKKLLHLRKSFGPGIFSMQADHLVHTDTQGRTVSAI